MHLGLSPHPRVILAVEGETEESHVPRIWQKLGYPQAPELVRLLKLGGTKKDPVKVAALATTPLVTRLDQSGKFWWINKPPTRFMVVIDPENYYSPTEIDKTRRLILDEIRTGLAVQGAKATEDELSQLVELRTWKESCYEFEHFSDDELADAIIEVHMTCDGWSREELVSALAYWRARRDDIKRVWESGRWNAERKRVTGAWEYSVSKTKLADALWPILEKKIEFVAQGQNTSVPAIVRAVADAFMVAQNWRYKNFVLTALTDEVTTSG